MKTKRTVILPLFITGVFLITDAQRVHATVEENWPAGTPNTCRNTDDFFLNFEAGIDEIEVESTIPSMQFTTTGTLNWKYADIRTDKYNVYPHNEAAYDTNGNFFAWTGDTGHQGRIDFLGGGASYCSVLVSTGSGLVLDAYDSNGVLIANSGWAGNNLNTRTFTRLTVEAPAGKTIAYVMIHDTGNFWLIDDLCTDANKAVMPVPGRAIGSHDDRIDIVFVPEDDYGTPADIDSWLPNFIQDVQNQIDQRLGAAAPVTGNLDSFNFYYAISQANITADAHNLPAGITRVAPWADAYSILHTAPLSDWTEWGPPVTFGAEGAIGRSFIHEGGHGIFGLADEYDDAPDCTTARFEPSPNPNVWDDEADCRADVTSEGWGNPDDCWMFTTCTTDWWKFTATDFIMRDGSFFANGWGLPASRRIEGVLDDNPGTASAEAGSSGETDKSIWLNMEVSAGVFSLLEESYVVAGAPNHRLGGDTFTVKVFSNGNAVLKEFGMHDPRIVQVEPGTDMPTWRDKANFQLVVPYFPSGSKVDLIESATGDVKLSVDISKYSTAKAPEAVCQNTTVALDANGKASITANDVDGGSADPDGGSVELSIDKSEFTCADLGENKVTLTATDEEGNPAACTAIVTVSDTVPPTISGPPNVTIECDKSIDPSNTGKATAKDNCSASPSITYSDVESIGKCPNARTIVRTWSASDSSGNTSSSTQTITVADTTPPTISFNAKSTITPPSVPVSFTATASDNCAENPSVSILDYYCYKLTKKGKEVSKMDSCVVKADGATVTIMNSGGVDTYIKWRAQAQDQCGNISKKEHELVVINPSKSK